MKKNARIEIRVTKEMKEHLQALAKAENRSLSSLIEDQLLLLLREEGSYLVGSKSHFRSL